MDLVELVNRVQDTGCSGKRFAFFADCGHDIEAVVRFLGEAGEKGVENVFFLGDVASKHVGSHLIMKVLQEDGIPAVAGDKDISLLALTGNLKSCGLDEFYLRTARHLVCFNSSDLDYLSSLPVKIRTELFDVAHASPLQPYFDDALEQEGYDFSRIEKMKHKRLLEKPCFVGHAGRAHIHYPHKRIRMREGREYELEGRGIIYVPRLTDDLYTLYDAEQNTLQVCRLKALLPPKSVS